MLQQLLLQIISNNKFSTSLNAALPKLLNHSLIKKTALSGLLLSIGQLAQAENLDGLMRSNQKFGVVVAVLVLILAGLFAALFFLEKRLKKLEAKIKNK